MKDLKLSLIIEALDRATAPLRKVAGALEGIEKRAEKVHAVFHKLGAAELIGGAFFTGAVVEGARAIFELTKRTAEYGVEARHAADKSAMSIEEIQKLQFAAKMLDVDSDSLGETMFRFNQHVVSAALGSKREERALRAMGVQIKDTHGQLKPLYELFLEFSDAFSKMDPRKANFAAFTMLGRGGVQSIPLLKQGSAALLAFGKEAEELGVIMDDDTADKAEGFLQHMKLVGFAIDGLKTRLGIQLMPAMDAFLVKLKDVIVHLQPTAIKGFSDALGQLLAQLPAILTLFTQFIQAVANAVPTVVKFTNSVGGVNGVMKIFVGILATQALVALGQFIFMIASGGASLVRFIGLMTSLIELSAGVRTFAGAMLLLDLAMEANPIGVVVLAVTALIAAIAAVGVGVYLIYKNWSGITAWFKGVWDTVEKVFADGWKRISDMTPDWLRAFLKLNTMGFSIVGQGIGAAVGAVPHGAPAKPAGHARTDIHLHVTSDGVQVKKLTSSDPSASLTIHRGVLPA
jgi:hypothetical protein